MPDPFEDAVDLWRQGAARLLAGDLQEAVHLFTRSLELRPSAEAYTFRGWAYSFEGKLDLAIEECPRRSRRTRPLAIPTTTSAAISWSRARWTRPSSGSRRPSE